MPTNATAMPINSYGQMDREEIIRPTAASMFNPRVPGMGLPKGCSAAAMLISLPYKEMIVLWDGVERNLHVLV